ncbi:unnamed protein product [Coccothraustes coccothraustes]
MPRILRGQKPVACCNLRSSLCPECQKHRKLQRPKKHLSKMPNVKQTEQVSGYDLETLHDLLRTKAMPQNLTPQLLNYPPGNHSMLVALLRIWDSLEHRSSLHGTTG